MALEAIHPEGVRRNLWPSSLSVADVVAYYEVRASNDRAIWTYAIDEGLASPLSISEADERNPRFSPDGRWIAYVSDKSGRDEIWLRPYPKTSESEYLISVSGGGSPAWASSGKELYYIDLSGNLVSVPLVFVPSPMVGAPETLFSLSGFELNLYLSG